MGRRRGRWCARDAGSAGVQLPPGGPVHHRPIVPRHHVARPRTMAETISGAQGGVEQPRRQYPAFRLGGPFQPHRVPRNDPPGHAAAYRLHAHHWMLHGPHGPVLLGGKRMAAIQECGHPATAAGIVVHGPLSFPAPLHGLGQPLLGCHQVGEPRVSALRGYLQSMQDRRPRGMGLVAEVGSRLVPPSARPTGLLFRRMSERTEISGYPGWWMSWCTGGRAPRGGIRALR